MSLIDRSREKQQLRKLAERGEPSLALLYGRRRVGKTFLLRQLWESDPDLFYYLASDTTSTLNRRELTRAFAEFTGDTALDADDLGTWRAVFRRMLDSEDTPEIIVLDEFQYLLGGEDDIRSQLVAIWDLLEADRSLLLVLCGSAIRTMEELDGAQSPLYGRIDWKRLLNPFDYWDTAKMAPFSDPRELIKTYGVFGGTPDYLASLRQTESFRENVARTALSPQGKVRHLVESVIEQERGLQKISQYRSILRAIANGATTVNRIATNAGLEKGTPLRKKLEKLEAIGLVERRQNFEAPDNAPYYYHLSDPALRFNERVTTHLRSELEMSDPLDYWEDLVEPRLRTHMGHIFERVVKQAYARLHRKKGLTPYSEWGFWEGQDRHRQSVEIDIVTRLTDDRILTGAVKWNRTPIEVSVFNAHLADLNALANSGREWAHRALDDDDAELLFAAAGGFTRDFEKMAEASSHDVHLWTLEQMVD